MYFLRNAFFLDTHVSSVGRISKVRLSAESWYFCRHNTFSCCYKGIVSLHYIHQIHLLNVYYANMKETITNKVHNYTSIMYILQWTILYLNSTTLYVKTHMHSRKNRGLMNVKKYLCIHVKKVSNQWPWKSCGVNNVSLIQKQFWTCCQWHDRCKFYISMIWIN